MPPFLGKWSVLISIASLIIDKVYILHTLRQAKRTPSGPYSIMTTLRQFRLEDLLTFNSINLDVLTETYNGEYAARPETAGEVAVSV